MEADNLDPGLKVLEFNLGRYMIAEKCYGTGGWVSHTTGNIWGHAAQVRDILCGMFA
jgi:hypothetical protein